MRRFDCPICARLGSSVKSLSAPGSAAESRYLPAAAARLGIIPAFDHDDKDRSHLRRCPQCAALYAYRLRSVATTRGREDEETLIRLTPATAGIFFRRQARWLEALRRDIDSAEGRSAALADSLVHRPPPPEEDWMTAEHLQSLRARILHGRKRLQVQVEAFRRACPEILLIWAQAHRRVGRSYLFNLGKPAGTAGDDEAKVRVAAGEIMAAWEALPESGETFISIPYALLAGYDARLREDLDS